MRQVDIKGFEDYQITDDGRVWSKKNKRYLKLQKTTPGYCKVSLSKNGNVYQKQVHRLVAETFISNPDNLPQVNHRDEDKTNNRVENLEYCSKEYNMNYGTIKERISNSVKKNTIFNTDNPNPPKQTCQYNLNGDLVAVYRSVSEAAIKTNNKQPTITRHIKNGKPLKGYVFKYKNEQPK